MNVFLLRFVDLKAVDDMALENQQVAGPGPVDVRSLIELRFLSEGQRKTHFRGRMVEE